MTLSDFVLVLILGFASCCFPVGRGGSPGRAPGTVLRWFLGWWRTGGARGSGGRRDDHDPMERFEDLAGPGPVAGQPEPASPATAAEPGRDVQHLEPQ